MSEHSHTYTAYTLFSKNKNLFLDLWYFEDDDLDEFETEQFFIKKNLRETNCHDENTLKSIFNQWLVDHKKIQDEYNFEIVEVEIVTTLK